VEGLKPPLRLPKKGAKPPLSLLSLLDTPLPLVRTYQMKTLEIRRFENL
jgi:hypothetical protein